MKNGKQGRFSPVRFMKENPHYWYFLFIPCYIACYFLVEYLVPSTADYWVSYLPVDDRIPFLEIFVIPYGIWYVYLLGAGVALAVYDVPRFKKYAQFLIFGCAVSLLICLLFPNGQDLRPETFPRDNLFTHLVAAIYAADTNTNVLPSMHVVGCVAAICGVWHTQSRAKALRWPVLILGLLIIASTVFIKQHSVLDIIAGVAVCVPVYVILYHGDKLFRRRKPDSDGES